MTILEAIGNTPLVEVSGIHAKLEYLNPSGSIKDRMALHIAERAEKAGLLKRGYTITEATSGNTGIAFSMIAALRGYRMVAVMPRGLSSERTAIMRAYGAEVVHPKHDCFVCAIELAEKYGKKNKHYLPKQFENPWNAEAEARMAKEVLEKVTPDAFVAGVGTGGTVIGAGRELKKHGTHVVALEPEECALLTQAGIGKLNYNLDNTRCKKHGIEGIGDGILPELVKKNKDVIDEVRTVSTEKAIEVTRQLAKLGYFVGPSSGANMAAAEELQREFDSVLTVFPDRGARYVSEKIF